jgi:TolB protein
MAQTRLITMLAAAVGATAILGAQGPPQPPPAQPPARPQTEVEIRISGTGIGLQARIAVPDFIPLTNDPQTAAAAKTIGQVLWDDLDFEREFYMIGRDTYRTIPQGTSLEDVPLDRWKELGADGLVVGTVQKTAAGVEVQYRLVEVNSGRSAIARRYSGSPRSVGVNESRQYAHTIADEIHKQQRALEGVARTKLAFSSNRDGERMAGPVAPRDISNIYMVDYDGANPRRLTATRSLDIAPAWAPDRSAIAYMSYRTGYADILIHFMNGTKYITPAKGGPAVQNYLPAWSPDGTKIAFMSSRDGDPEIYVMNRDGGGVRRLTNHPANDVTPTWSPTGTQIAFTSNRSGNPQIWVVNADGTGLRQITREAHCDRPTWSPAPFNEIAYASRSGAGNVIKVFDFEKGESRAITDDIGNNESPSFAPNGRHLAFVSSRAGKDQIFTIARDGNGLRQVTREGTNKFPNWSR